jgi:hypothetical protein
MPHILSKGLNPEDWHVSKEHMIAQFAEVGPEKTVRTHLRQLKQTGTVTEYHRAFRNIQVQAITHPVTGAEAVFMFKEGLTRSLRNKLMADSAIKMN